jgi:ElaB/YqjD/DUF883 family membrane-anchored ribosome-binding protein
MATELGDDTSTDRETGNGAQDSGGRRSASEAYEAARLRTSALYDSARERALSAYESTRDGASRAGRRTADEIDANPVAALIGGLAIGAAVAALLPRSRHENRALGPLGSRINDTAREAALAARDAGREKLEELGLNREGIRQRLNEFTDTASEAMRSSASAAAKKVKTSKKS